MDLPLQGWASPQACVQAGACAAVVHVSSSEAVLRGASL